MGRVLALRLVELVVSYGWECRLACLYKVFAEGFSPTVAKSIPVLQSHYYNLL